MFNVSCSNDIALLKVLIAHIFCFTLNLIVSFMFNIKFDVITLIHWISKLQKSVISLHSVFINKSHHLKNLFYEEKKVS